MAYEFSTHQIPSMGILYVRDEVEPDAFPAFLGSVFPELYAHVGQHRIAAVGQPFVMYHAFGPDRIDAQVCVPVTGPAPVEGRIHAGTLPAVMVVRTLHVGPYEELGSAYAALTEWVGDHGMVEAGPVRERYLTGVGDDVPPAQYRTELDQPVEQAPATSVTEEVPPTPVEVS